MDKTLLINIIWFAVLFVLGVVAKFITAYLKAKGEITEEAAHQIAVAEEAYAAMEKAGENPRLKSIACQLAAYSAMMA